MEYSKINLSSLTEENIENTYLTLLTHKYSFMVLSTNHQNYILTKERSIIPVENLDKFLKEREKDIYYKTIIQEDTNSRNIEKELNLFYYYLNQYRLSFHKLYGGKYRFGCIAIRIDDHSFLTTIRGKKELDEYTIVNSVDFKNHIVSVRGKKATLNAPLLSHLFQNKKVNAVVHLHEFHPNLPYYEYAFPGTELDSIRENTTSFNIRYHGAFLLFDQDGNLL